MIPRLKNFRFALNGILKCIKSEVNFRWHLAAIIIVIITGFYFKIETFEWFSVIFVIGFVLFAELLNTAVEVLVDFVSPEINPHAELAKDLSAGAVLIAAVTSVVIGFFVFVPKIISALFPLL